MPISHQIIKHNRPADIAADTTIKISDKYAMCSYSNVLPNSKSITATQRKCAYVPGSTIPNPISLPAAARFNNRVTTMNTLYKCSNIIYYEKQSTASSISLSISVFNRARFNSISSFISSRYIL